MVAVRLRNCDVSNGSARFTFSWCDEGGKSGASEQPLLAADQRSDTYEDAKMLTSANKRLYSSYLYMTPGEESMKRIRVREGFVDTIARVGLTMTGFAEHAGVNRATLYALINPAQHPKRRGGMLRATAWKLSRAYAVAAGIDEETAFARLLVEEDIDTVTIRDCQ